MVTHDEVQRNTFSVKCLFSLRPPHWVSDPCAFCTAPGVLFLCAHVRWIRWHKHAARFSRACVMLTFQRRFPHPLQCHDKLFTGRCARNRHVATRCVAHSRVPRFKRGAACPLLDRWMLFAQIRILRAETVIEEESDVNCISIVMILICAPGCPHATPASARDAPPEHFDIARSKCDPEDHLPYETVGIPFLQCRCVHDTPTLEQPTISAKVRHILCSMLLVPTLSSVLMVEARLRASPHVCFKTAAWAAE